MNPLFEDGQFVVGNTLFDFDQLKKFDIIVYEFNGQHFCHYLWKKFNNFETQERDIVQTRPLNPVWDYDDYIAKDKIVAVVVNKKISKMRQLYIEFISLFVGKGKV